MLATTFTQKQLVTAQTDAATASAALQRIEADDDKPLSVLSSEALTGRFEHSAQIGG